MRDPINKLITEEIRKDKEDQSVKSFLLNILMLEQKHASEAKWRFNAEYENLLARGIQAQSRGKSE